ncbi:MAG: HAD family hydrolase [Patescibacteria group bacterium]
MFDLGNVLFLIDTQRFCSTIAKHSTNDVSPVELLTGRFSYLFRLFELDKLNQFSFYEEVSGVYGLSGLDFREFCELLCAVFNPDYRILNLMLALKGNGIQLALITNISRLQLQYLRKAYPEFFIQFDSIAASCELGVRKPDPEIWIYSFDEIGAKAEGCFFIDDYLPNVEAFRGIGGMGFHYNVVDERCYPNGKLEIERNSLLLNMEKLGILSLNQAASVARADFQADSPN